MLLSIIRHIWKVRAARNILPFIAVAAAVFCVNEASSALVRHSVQVYGGFWVLKPLVFVNHLEVSDGTRALPGPNGKLMYGILTILVVGLSLRGLRHHRDAPFCWHRAGLGLAVGGMVANGYQLLIVGSVTDFIGIRPLGILGVRRFSQVFSFADLTIILGLWILGVFLSPEFGELRARIRQGLPFSGRGRRQSVGRARDRRAS